MLRSYQVQAIYPSSKDNLRNLHDHTKMSFHQIIQKTYIWLIYIATKQNENNVSYYCCNATFISERKEELSSFPQPNWSCEILLKSIKVLS